MPDYLSLGFNGGNFFSGGGPAPGYDPLADPLYFPDVVLGPDWGVYTPPIVNDYPQPPIGPRQAGPWPQLIAADIAAGLKTISIIFAPAAATAAQAQYGQQPQYIYQPGAYPGTGATPRSTTGAGFDSTGLNLFGSKIGWWPIAIVAFGFYLLQSRPVGRR